MTIISNAMQRLGGAFPGGVGQGMTPVGGARSGVIARAMGPLSGAMAQPAAPAVPGAPGAALGGGLGRLISGGAPPMGGAPGAPGAAPGGGLGRILPSALMGGGAPPMGGAPGAQGAQGGWLAHLLAGLKGAPGGMPGGMPGGGPGPSFTPPTGGGLSGPIGGFHPAPVMQAQGPNAPPTPPPIPPSMVNTNINNNAAHPGDTPEATYARNTTANPATGAGPLALGTSGSGNTFMDQYAQGKIDYPTMQAGVNDQNARSGSLGFGADAMKASTDDQLKQSVQGQYKSLLDANHGDAARARQAFLNPIGAGPDPRAIAMLNSFAPGG